MRSQGEASLSPADLPAHGHEAHKAAGQADAAGMRTGSAMNPPPGMAFDAAGGHAPTDTSGQGAAGAPTGDAGAAADAPGDIIGVRGLGVPAGAALEGQVFVAEHGERTLGVSWLR